MTFAECLADAMRAYERPPAPDPTYPSPQAPTAPVDPPQTNAPNNQ